MFTLYMKWDARRELAPEDIQFILSPDEAMTMAAIFYELDYLTYPQRIIPHHVPDRKKAFTIVLARNLTSVNITLSTINFMMM